MCINDIQKMKRDGWHTHCDAARTKNVTHMYTTDFTVLHRMALLDDNMRSIASDGNELHKRPPLPNGVLERGHRYQTEF